MPLLAPDGSARTGVRRAALFLPAVLLAAACTAPPPAPPPQALTLEPPVFSPPGQWPAADRAAWWENRLHELRGEDRAEALLCLGELYLELEQPERARESFFQALEAELTVREAARAERGIGLSHFLSGAPRMGLAHLERARGGLERPAAEEVALLIQAARGQAQLAADPELLQRAQPYLKAAGLEPVVPRAAAAPVAQERSMVDLTRAQWKAKNLQANHDPMGKPFRITVHHTAEPITGDSLAATIAEVQNIQMLHVRDRHWADIGYHFLIDRAGRVVEGRSMQVQGAHAGNSDANRGNIGIALMGNFEAQPERGPEYLKVQEPTAAQIAALDRLVAALRAEYGIAAREIWGHDHFRDTECPGSRLRTWVAQQRSGRGSAGAGSLSAGTTKR